MGFRVKEGGSRGGTPDPTGSPNFYKEVGSGLGFRSLVKATQDQRAGFGVEQAPSTLLTEQTAGLGVNTFASGEVLPSISTGMSMGSALNMVIPPQDETGFDIETKVYEYIGFKPLQTASNIGSDNFTNPTNAEGGVSGQTATRVGQALSTTSAELRGQHVPIPYNNSININSIQLKFYVDQTGTVLNNGGLELAYRINSSSPWQILVTYTGNVNFITSNPDTYTLTGFTTWQEVDAVETKVSAILTTLTSQVRCRCNAIIKHVKGAE
jgi:hypothetical protein